MTPPKFSEISWLFSCPRSSHGRHAVETCEVTTIFPHGQLPVAYLLNPGACSTCWRGCHI